MLETLYGLDQLTISSVANPLQNNTSRTVFFRLLLTLSEDVRLMQLHLHLRTVNQLYVQKMGSI